MSISTELGEVSYGLMRDPNTREIRPKTEEEAFLGPRYLQPRIDGELLRDYILGLRAQKINNPIRVIGIGTAIIRKLEMIRAVNPKAAIELIMRSNGDKGPLIICPEVVDCPTKFRPSNKSIGSAFGVSTSLSRKGTMFE